MTLFASYDPSAASKIAYLKSQFEPVASYYMKGKRMVLPNNDERMAALHLELRHQFRSAFYSQFKNIEECHAVLPQLCAFSSAPNLEREVIYEAVKARRYQESLKEQGFMYGNPSVFSAPIFSDPGKIYSETVDLSKVTPFYVREFNVFRMIERTENAINIAYVHKASGYEDNAYVASGVFAEQCGAVGRLPVNSFYYIPMERSVGFTVGHFLHLGKSNDPAYQIYTTRLNALPPIIDKLYCDHSLRSLPHGSENGGVEYRAFCLQGIVPE